MNLNPEITLTIAIPTRNRPHFLSKLIDEILAQKINLNIEIVIVDDCSSEENWNLIKEIWKKDSCVKLFRNKKQLGLTLNWNKSISYSSGQWICLMCDDDMFKPRALERIKYLISESEKPCLILQNANIGTDTEWLEPSTLSAIKVALPPASGQIWHRELSEKIGLFDIRIKYCPDAEFWPRFAYHYPVLLVKEYFVIPFQHDTNAMWENLEKEDFLEQIALSIDLISKWHLGIDYNDKEKVKRFIDNGIWETLRTTLNNCFLTKGKMKKFLYYFFEFIKYSFKTRRILQMLITVINLPILRLKDFLRPIKEILCNG